MGNELYGDDGFRGQIKEYTKNPGSLPLLTGVISNWTKIFTVIANEEKQSQSLPAKETNHSHCERREAITVIAIASFHFVPFNKLNFL